MRSDVIKKGIEKAPHRSLLKAMGFTDDELKRPIIGIANSWSEIIPGHIHLDKIAQAVKAVITSYSIHYTKLYDIIVQYCSNRT